MEKVLILLLLGIALTESFLPKNLDNKSKCLQSKQCKSGCCVKPSGFKLPQCADLAAEGDKCSPKHIIGIYFECPCGDGLKCDAKSSMLGKLFNRDFGTCKPSEDEDSSEEKSSKEQSKEQSDD